MGNKSYELSNHLGNILAVISDNKMFMSSNLAVAKVQQSGDYLSFGLPMPARGLGNSYRYGFNGKENTPLGWQDYGFRVSNKISVNPCLQTN